MESARTSIDRVFHEWDYEMERAFPAFCVDRKTLDGEGYNVGTPCHARRETSLASFQSWLQN